VSLSVERGVARSGARVRVTGEPLLGERALLIRRATLSAPSRGSVLTRWRAAAGRSIDGTFGGDAGLARALLIADTRGIPIEMRDRYAAAGVVHLLSISGLHVAIIASAVQLVLQLLRFPGRSVAVAALGLTALYIAMIGAPAPAVRSGVMLGVTAISRLAQRPTSPWASLALGALVPLVQPRTVLDLGYQLSVAGMAGIVASGALARRAITPALQGPKRWLATNLAASVIASLVTTPLVAWTFGRVSLIAPVTNLVATPLLGLAQPMLFLALLIAPLKPVARFVADATHPLLALFDLVSVAGADVPYASIPVAPTIGAAFLGGVVSVALIVACVGRFPGRPLIAATAATSALVWLPLLPAPHAGVELHMIDVGQGDALALRTPANRWILFDAGRTWRGGDAGRTSVIPYVRRRGGTVEAFVLSHPHDDHVGGAATVLDALRPRLYLDAAYAGGSEAYRASLSVAVRRQIPWRRVHPGDSLDIDGVLLRVLGPDSAWTAGLDDANDASVIIMARYGDIRFLLTGDAETAEESWLVESAGELLDADVLKVAHHGSRTSTSPGFLAAVRPRIALISVGAGNRYGHPGARVLDDLAERGALVVRTDRSGSVVVRTDGRQLTLEVQGDSWPLSNASVPP
jgi:competence protein ComEC